MAFPWMVQVLFISIYIIAVGVRTAENAVVYEEATEIVTDVPTAEPTTAAIISTSISPTTNGSSSSPASITNPTNASPQSSPSTNGSSSSPVIISDPTDASPQSSPVTNESSSSPVIITDQTDAPPQSSTATNGSSLSPVIITDPTDAPPQSSPATNGSSSSPVITTDPTNASPQSSPATSERSPAVGLTGTVSIVPSRSPEATSLTELRSPTTNGPTESPSSSEGPTESVTESKTSKAGSTAPQEPTSPVPVYPAETYPDITGSDAIRKIRIEVAVDDDSCEVSEPESDPCKALKATFEEFAEDEYRKVTGYLSVVLGELRSGSVIIEHEVSYDYNEMTGEDRQLSAEEIYDRTIAPSVNGEENVGSFTFTTCDDCSEPEELSQLCAGYNIDCPGNMDQFCAGDVGLLVCQSPCERKEDPYCSEETAMCTQGSTKDSPSCLCLQTEDGWYIGAQCQIYVDRFITILVVSIGGGLLLILFLVLCICLCRTKKQLKESRQLPFEQNTAAFILGQGELELSDTRHTMYNNEGYDGISIDGDYPRGVDSFKPQLEKAAKESAEKRNSQYFWGNVIDDVIEEPEQLMSTKLPKENGESVAVNGNVNSSEPADPFSKRYSKVSMPDYKY